MSENVFWKLDRAENFSRMHMKLVRDFTGNQHTDASMARDQAGQCLFLYSHMRVPWAIYKVIRDI